MPSPAVILHQHIGNLRAILSQVIRIAGYVFEEKLAIANQPLWLRGLSQFVRSDL